MKKHDIAILGGGLAGLTLALQLKRLKPDVRVIVLEKRDGIAPEATHKVGESTSELSAFYLRNVLNLQDYLNDHQLRKYGFRFFFSQEHTGDITRRVEVGSRIDHPIHTHQIDRGVFENDLIRLLEKAGVEIHTGATVTDIVLSGAEHEVSFEKNSAAGRIAARWIVDSTGRRSLLKRKLGLEKNSGHDVNAAWFRLDGPIDPDLWSEDESWRNYLTPGRRRLATNHLMGTGYWVWLIPLISGATSIGIVADPTYHPFDRFNTFEKALQWLKTNEPQAADEFEKLKVLDFKVMKHFAHDTQKFYSSDRWAVTGDAGAFLDPFYSPGSDFIALSNSWITDLIARDLEGEDIALRTMIFEHAHRELLNGWLLLYKDMYGLFGNTQIMLMKIVWDWGTYWSFPALIFSCNGYTNLDFLKLYSETTNGIGRRFALLNSKMQALFLDWGRYRNEPCDDKRINLFDLDCLLQFYLDLKNGICLADLFQRIEKNLNILEHIAAEIFRRASVLVHVTPDDMPVDPYTMSLNDGPETLLEKSSRSMALSVRDGVKADIDRVWLIPVETTREAYV